MLRAAVAVRSMAASTDALVRVFDQMSTQRAHPSAPTSVEMARSMRASVEDVITSAHSNARSIEEAVDPLIGIAFMIGKTAGIASAVEELKTARDALLASLATLASVADDLVDVLIRSYLENHPMLSSMVSDCAQPRGVRAAYAGRDV